MRPKVGVFFSRLQETHPRGVVRVARAICQRLALSEDIDCYAIGHPCYSNLDAVVPSIPLDRFLTEVPMVSSPSLLHTVRRHVHNCLTWPGVKRLGASIAGRLRDNRRLRSFYRRLSSAKLVFMPRNPEVLQAGDYAALGSFDAILSFESFEPIWDYPLELFRCKKVGFFHDAIPLRIREGVNWDPDLYFRATGRFALRADHIICNSYQSERDLNTFFPTSLGKTSVVHLGHDVERMSRARVLNPKCPTEFSGAKPTVTLTMIGDYDLRKNVSTVLRSMPFLAERMPDTHICLLLIGNSKAKRQFTPLQDSCSRFAEIRWLGYLDDDELAKQLSESDVFVFPSLWEGFGIPVLEAMSAGVPVVCSDLSSLPEVGGEFAGYCDPYDPRSIAEVLHKVLTLGPPERAKLIDDAARWAAGFTWSRTAGAIEDTIRRLVKDRTAQ